MRRVFITSEILRIYQWSQYRYGSTRIAKELAFIGIKVSRTYVAEIMMEQNMQSIAKLKWKKTTNCAHNYIVARNSLNQNFKTNKRNEVWISDITYIETAEGWIYLTVIIDLFDRKVIGWSFSETLKAKDTSIAAFRNALRHRSLKSNERLIFHSDRGIQYACQDFISVLIKTNQIIQSMSGKGNYYDNAVAESFSKP